MSGPPLRVLAACAACGRQYDATGRAAEDRFRCSCGEVVTVPTARPHDAAVVCCSACGGPREGAAERCAYCGADFTLHERDLDTLCPRCMTRLSRKARFCHACATPITASADAGTRTDLGCPACAPAPGAPAAAAGDSGAAPRLVSRRLEPGAALSLLECGRCAGVWLDRETFRLLADEARRGHAATGLPAEPPPAGRRPAERPVGAPPDATPLYRPCPVCGALMNRSNYGRKSGVIVDLCREHGVWFDAEELDRVLLWLRRGGAERAARLAAEQERWERRAPSQIPAVPMPLGGDPWGPGWDGRGGFIGYLVDLVIGEAGDWFGHR